jgi:hypothetical protein
MTWSERKGYKAQLAYRFLQCIVAITVIGLYAQSLNKSGKEHNDSGGFKSSWSLLNAKHASPYPANPLLTPLQSYAVAYGSMSAISSVLYGFKLYNIRLIWIWDIVMTVLGLIQFVLWAKLYLGGPASYDMGIKQMKISVWINLAHALSWAVSTIGMLIYRKMQLRKGVGDYSDYA